jgi:pyrimidine operon attenuation protein/uracil phosphoribosyltransferase
MDLGTTNIMLGIMAGVAVLEALLLIGIGVGGFMAYRRVMTLVNGIEERHVAPAMARVNAILDDAKGVSARVKDEADRVDHAFHTTMDRVDDTVDRVRGNVRAKTSRIIGLVRGARVALESILQDRTPPRAA